MNVLKVSFQKYSYLRAIEKCLFMKKLINSFVFVMLVLLSSCAGSGTPKGEFVIRQLNDCSPDSDQYVLIETNKGNIKFSAETDCAIRSGNFSLIDVENTSFENVTDTLVKGYGGEGEIRAENVSGVKHLLRKVDEKFSSDNI